MKAIMASVRLSVQRALLAVLLMSSAVAARAQPEWTRLYCDDPAFSVEAPAGWQIVAVEGRGARLVPPDAGPVVEVVVWDALHLPATPETAAVEHEAVLARAIDYRRGDVRRVETAGGAGLVVSGSVRSSGVMESSIFCAYAAGDRHYILGTFAPASRLAELRAELIDRMMLSFRPEEEAAPAPPPGEPPERPEPVAPADRGEVQPGPAPSTIRVGPQDQPIGPELRAPGPPWIEHVNPRGFSLSMPADWEVRCDDGLILVVPAGEEERTRLLAIWPVSGDDPGAEQALRELLARVPEVTPTRVEVASEEGKGATVLDAQAEGHLRVAATWAHEGWDGLLIVAVGPAVTWAADRLALARIAASFSPGAWPAPRRAEREVIGDAGLMSWRLPMEWESSGGVRDEGGELGIETEAQGPEPDRLQVAWRQPLAPRFRALTPLLESLGWREGERYSVPDSSSGLLIYRRREPAEMIEDLLLPRHSPALSGVEVDATRAGGAVSGLVTGTDASGEIVRVTGESAEGRRERLYLAATGRSRPPLTATCWDGAVLWAGAPEGRLAEAVRALVRMVESASPTETGAERHRGGLGDLLERACAAVGAIPGDLRSGAEPAGLQGVVGADAVTWDRTWRLPVGALQHWAEQAGEPGSITVGPRGGMR